MSISDRSTSLDRAIIEQPHTSQRPRWGDRPHVLDAVWIISALLAVLIVGWVVAVFASDSVHFVLPNATGRPGLEMFLALGHLFGALVLVLSSLEPARPGMRWVAMGLLVLGTAGLVFGSLLRPLGVDLDPTLTMYSSGMARCLAAALIAIGLVPDQPPALHRREAAAIVIGGALATLLLLAIGDSLPALVTTTNWSDLIPQEDLRTLPGLTLWHFSLGLIPLVVSYAALWGAVRQARRHYVSGWLVIGLVLFSGAQLHAMFWPSLYSSLMTSTSVLRFVFTLVVIFGGVLELYALSRDRATLLSREQERVRQLEELGEMKRDFTSMVAHELGTPLAAINNLAQMMMTGVLPETEKQKVAGRIQHEARLLQLLVRDVQESDNIERDDFSVDLQRVPLKLLLEDAYAYAETAQRGNPLTLDVTADGDLIADPDRIRQVIRNLLNNAVRHTQAGTPITLRASREQTGIRVEIIDQGPGIPPGDQQRILEKFGRGSNARGEGSGLGLYLSQRILQAHGSSLIIESGPERGSNFSFRLEESP